LGAVREPIESGFTMDIGYSLADFGRNRKLFVEVFSD
jgi:hypothetical protein